RAARAMRRAGMMRGSSGRPTRGVGDGRPGDGRSVGLRWSALVAARVRAAGVVLGDGHAGDTALTAVLGLELMLLGLLGLLDRVDGLRDRLAGPLGLRAVLGLEDHHVVVGLDDQAVE